MYLTLARHTGTDLVYKSGGHRDFLPTDSYSLQIFFQFHIQSYSPTRYSCWSSGSYDLVYSYRVDVVALSSTVYSTTIKATKSVKW